MNKPLTGLNAPRAEPKLIDENAVVLRGDGEPKTIPGMINQLRDLYEAEGVALDVFQIGGIVEKLEKRFASILGKEMAVFMPTGTLANHLALRQLCVTKPRAIVQEQSHLYHDTGDCLVQLSGVTLVPLGHKRAYFSVEELRETLDGSAVERVARPVGALMIETPVRRQHGLVVPYDVIVSITEFCKKQGIATHLDGARIYMMSAITGISPLQYASHFDTVYVSLYKYFGAPFGGILAGPRSLLENMYHARRMFGSGLASAGFAAALAYRGMDGFEGRFAEAMSKGKALIGLINELEDIRVEQPANGSNLFRINLDSRVNIARFLAALRQRSVFLFPDDTDPNGYHLTINTTVLRQSNETIASAFKEALKEART